MKRNHCSRKKGKNLNKQKLGTKPALIYFVVNWELKQDHFLLNNSRHRDGLGFSKRRVRDYPKKKPWKAANPNDLYEGQNPKHRHWLNKAADQGFVPAWRALKRM